MALEPRQAKFVQEYLVDLNATQAAIRAGYAPKAAQEQASRLLSNAIVRAEVDKGIEARAARTEITVDKVLKRWWQIANADPNELMELRRVACPKCETPEINPVCEECGGEGINRPFFHDTRHLKGGARLLYAGVKVTKDGLEMKTHDQLRALEQVARHLGMFVDKKQLLGADGQPVDPVAPTLTVTISRE